MILSILIPTTIDRRELFYKLETYLKIQKAALPDEFVNSVEIISHEDNKEISVGKKRQNLLLESKGDYVVYIDSDDFVHPAYLISILNATKENPDCIGFKIECDINGVKSIASSSNKYLDWGENLDGFKFVRTIYHKTPIKRDLALKIGFKDMRFGEDYDFSKRLKQSGLLKKEVFIPLFLYRYIYKHTNPKERYGLKD